jgi:hypothetical protein
MSRSIDTVIGDISERERAYNGIAHSKTRKFYENVPKRATPSSIRNKCSAAMSRLGRACYLNAIETQHSRATRKIRFILSTMKPVNKEIPSRVEHGGCPFVNQEAGRKRHDISR